VASVGLASCSYVGFDFDAGPFFCESSLDCAAGFRCIRGVCSTGPDPGPPDSGAPDAGPADAGPLGDAGVPDAGSPDSGALDGGDDDGGVADAGADGGAVDAGLDAGDPCGTLTAPTDDAGALAAYCAVHRTMVIDGDLSDWAGVPFTLLDAANAGSVLGTTPFTADAAVNNADLSGMFAVQWDTEYLYVAASITDDVRAIHAASLAYFADDCFQLYLDGNHDRTVDYESDDLDLLVRADGAGQQYLLSTHTTLQGVPQGVLSAVADSGTAADWKIEMAVPWAQLGGSAAVPGRLVGFDLIMDDDDDLTTTQVRKHYLIWVQHTDGGCNEPYCSTASLGTIQLVGAAP
jgi:hypothetical protein